MATQATSEFPVSSPYYLHPSESPLLILVQPSLNEKNYHQWCRAMRMDLISKNKLSFVNGSIKVPDRANNSYAAWEICNNMVLSWILNSVSSSIA
jgi:hypothetical protein